MNKFGLMEEPMSDDESVRSGAGMAERLASFPPAMPRAINVAEMDAAAALHGFTSREPVAHAQTFNVTTQPGRRRRLGNQEATRHLAIRLAISQYDRFVAYADQHQLTYHDAVTRLLDQVGA